MLAALHVFPSLPLQIVCMMAVCFVLGGAFAIIALWLMEQARQSANDSQKD